MKYGSLVVEKSEYVYLKRILNISGYAEDFEAQKSLQRLSDELKNAQVVDDSEIPEDVIRFNTEIVVSSNNGWKNTIQLVKPTDRDPKLNKISILTPMGAALFGYSENDTIEWDFPSGKKLITLETVRQHKTKDKVEIAINKK